MIMPHLVHRSFVAAVRCSNNDGLYPHEKSLRDSQLENQLGGMTPATASTHISFALESRHVCDGADRILDIDIHSRDGNLKQVGDDTSLRVEAVAAVSSRCLSFRESDTDVHSFSNILTNYYVAKSDGRAFDRLKRASRSEHRGASDTARHLPVPKELA